MNTSPIKLRPFTRDVIWGGTKLANRYHKAEADTRLGESWELSLHPGGLCTVEDDGEPAQTLASVLGREEFPTLIKLIDAACDLSIQVHPSKTEMWIVLDCEEGASLIYGLKEPYDRDRFAASLADGSVESLLRRVPVHRGDVFFLPSGMVHAIGGGILVAEIQQSNDITYRVWDYGRLENGRPRALHVEQALDTIRDFTDEETEALRFSTEPRSEGLLAACPYFRTARMTVTGSHLLDGVPYWQCLLAIEGSGSINGRPIAPGDTYFLPASAPAVLLESDAGLTLLHTCLPTDRGEEREA